ncbi:hypothetical protein Tco_1515941, partial [Tanacetum coccineum]
MGKHSSSGDESWKERMSLLKGRNIRTYVQRNGKRWIRDEATPANAIYIIMLTVDILLVVVKESKKGQVGDAGAIVASVLPSFCHAILVAKRRAARSCIKTVDDSYIGSSNEPVTGSASLSGQRSLQHSMLSPATFQPFRQRHIAGETYPQRHVAGEKLMG